MTSRLTLLTLCAALFVIAIGIAVDTSDEIKFVFQLTRHGARAPSDGDDGFKVGPGMLTA